MRHLVYALLVVADWYYFGNGKKIMGWLRNRFGERSTRNGMVILSALLGLYLSPEQVDTIIASLAALYGVYETLRDESNP